MFAALLAVLISGCVHYWGGVRSDEVRFGEFLSSLGPDVPIALILEGAGKPKHVYRRDADFDIYLFHLIENSAWDGIPGPTAEAGVALLVERSTTRVRDARVTFEQAHRYPGWEAFMQGLASGSFRSKFVICTAQQRSVFCTGW